MDLRSAPRLEDGLEGFKASRRLLDTHPCNCKMTCLLKVSQRGSQLVVGRLSPCHLVVLGTRDVIIQQHIAHRGQPSSLACWRTAPGSTCIPLRPETDVPAGSRPGAPRSEMVSRASASTQPLREVQWLKVTKGLGLIGTRKTPCTLRTPPGQAVQCVFDYWPSALVWARPCRVTFWLTCGSPGQPEGASYDRCLEGEESGTPRGSLGYCHATTCQCWNALLAAPKPHWPLLRVEVIVKSYG